MRTAISLPDDLYRQASRGELWLADLGEPRGSEPVYTRSVLVVQDGLL